MCTGRVLGWIGSPVSWGSIEAVALQVQGSWSPCLLAPGLSLVAWVLNEVPPPPTQIHSWANSPRSESRLRCMFFGMGRWCRAVLCSPLHDLGRRCCCFFFVLRVDGISQGPKFSCFFEYAYMCLPLVPRFDFVSSVFFLSRWTCDTYLCGSLCVSEPGLPGSLRGESWGTR